MCVSKLPINYVLLCIYPLSIYMKKLSLKRVMYINSSPGLWLQNYLATRPQWLHCQQEQCSLVINEKCPNSGNTGEGQTLKSVCVYREWVGVPWGIEKEMVGFWLDPFPKTCCLRYLEAEYLHHARLGPGTWHPISLLYPIFILASLCWFYIYGGRLQVTFMNAMS